MHKLLGMLVLGLTLTIGFGSVGGCKKGEKTQTEEEKKAAKKKADDEAAAKKKADEEAALKKKKPKEGEEVPAAAGTVTIMAPGATEIKQGGMKEVTIKIERKKLDDPVEISFKGPEGVTAESVTIKKGESEAKLELKAAKDAKDGKGEGKLMAKAGKVTADATFEITVKKGK